MYAIACLTANLTIAFVQIGPMRKPDLTPVSRASAACCGACA
jgi:hypothetical protein